MKYGVKKPAAEVIIAFSGRWFFSTFGDTYFHMPHARTRTIHQYFSLDRNLSASQLLMVAVNLIPIAGVWLWGWSAREMFMVYCLETVIVGLYTLLQMIIAAGMGKGNDGVDSAGIKSGLGFALFFVFHFGLFVFVQMSMFLSVMKYPGFEDSFAAGFTFLLNFPRYLSKEALLVLICFAGSYGVTVVKEFILTGEYRKAILPKLMFQPYPRVIVQQFVIILGAFLVTLFPAASKVFIMLFAVVKTCMELVLRIRY